MHFADASLFIICAMSLTVFNITKATYSNKDGVVLELDPEVGYSSGVVRFVVVELPCLLHGLKSKYIL